MSQNLREHGERTPLLGEPTAPDINITATVRGIPVAKTPGTTATETKDIPASWLTLPKKRQLFLLALSRVVEPASQTSTLSYLYYFLRSLDPSLPPAAISRQAGYLASAFAICMFLTGWFWGRVADRIGRKKVLLIGLISTSVANIVFGFSESYRGLVIARCFAGLMDANIAILRTMITETVVDKK